MNLQAIEYPVLEKAEIKTFNIEEFVRSKKSDLGTVDLNSNSSSINDLIKEIDKKIEQLEMDEKLNKVENENWYRWINKQMNVHGSYFKSLILLYNNNDDGKDD